MNTIIGTPGMCSKAITTKVHRCCNCNGKVMVHFLLRGIPSLGIGSSKKFGIAFSNGSIGKQELLSK